MNSLVAGQGTGVPPAGSGHSPKGGAAKASPAKPSVPNAAIFARATEIAKARYPNGCASATKLAAIVREAIAELGVGQ